MREFTAHIRNINGKMEKQTVLTHSTDMLKVEDGTGIGCVAIVKLIYYAHDMGKCAEDFEGYIYGTNNILRGEIDHCYAGAKHIVELAEKTGDQKVKETAAFIARVVMSHHGLCDWLDKDGESYYKRRISKEERYEEILNNYRKMFSDELLTELLLEAAEEYKCIRKKILEISDGNRIKRAFYLGQFERLILSMLVHSDRTNTAGFMAGKEMELKYEQKIWDDFCIKMEEKCSEFSRLEDPVSQIRSDISNRCKRFSKHKVDIARLIVPTGGGKTFSSLRFALNYCKEQKKKRIFYIAPFMSILEQNCDVIKSVVGREYVLEHHSDALANICDEDELTEYELRTDQWDLPVIATTMVQFLNTFFSGKMSSVRRMHKLCNSVIIVDEVQSVPVKCVSLFNLALNFISKVGNATIVLCSATQPTLEKMEYGLLLDKEDSMTGDYRKDFQEFRRNRIVPMLQTEGYTYEEASEFCLVRYREEGSVLMVVNTKTAAATIFALLKAEQTDAEIVHLSTFMCPEHRRDRMDHLRKCLEEQKKVICITTPLIEAGVDISFPCVIRSLAGMDHLAQAAGRCNRSGEFKRCCSVYLLNLREERLGSLSEIKNGQDITRQMIAAGRYDDMLAVSTMSDYFQKFYMDMSGELNYSIEDAGAKTSLLDLLSVNTNRWKLKVHRKNSSSRSQAFKTAGQLFHVIEEAAQPVFVPYNEEAKTLIEELGSEKNPYDIMMFLRKAQKYMVDLYPNTIKELLGKALNVMECGALVLREEFYDREMGVQKEGKPMELLMF